MSAASPSPRTAPGARRRSRRISAKLHNSAELCGRPWRGGENSLPPAATHESAGAIEALPHRLEFRDHPLDHPQAAVPERRIAGIKTERLEQFRMMLGAAGRQHGEITLGKAVGGLLVDRVERIH